MVKLPDTLHRDDLEYDGTPSPVCYFVVNGNENSFFLVNYLTHELTVSTPGHFPRQTLTLRLQTNKELDRESLDTHSLLIRATEDCSRLPRNQSYFDPTDDTLLKVVVHVLDVNDNAPKFTHRTFTGGVSTVTDFGTEFMQVKVMRLF